jgi:hypothetical protein
VLFEFEAVVGAFCVGRDVRWLRSWARPASRTRKYSSSESRARKAGSAVRQ